MAKSSSTQPSRTIAGATAGTETCFFFSEEESQKVFSLLNARDEEEMGIILKERFFPKEPAPETERPVLNDLSRFLNAILDFLKANDIHWVEGYKTWYEDIQKETISTRYH